MQKHKLSIQQLAQSATTFSPKTQAAIKGGNPTDAVVQKAVEIWNDSYIS